MVGDGVEGWARWRCLKERVCEAAQVCEVSQSVVDEVVCVVMALRRMSFREVEVESEWRVQALLK
jgi:hypothetical protein